MFENHEAQILKQVSANATAENTLTIQSRQPALTHNQLFKSSFFIKKSKKSIQIIKLGKSELKGFYMFS